MYKCDVQIQYTNIMSKYMYKYNAHILYTNIIYKYNRRTEFKNILQKHSRQIS